MRTRRSAGTGIDSSRLRSRCSPSHAARVTAREPRRSRSDRVFSFNVSPTRPRRRETATKSRSRRRPTLATSPCGRSGASGFGASAGAPVLDARGTVAEGKAIWVFRRRRPRRRRYRVSRRARRRPERCGHPVRGGPPPGSQLQVRRQRERHPGGNDATSELVDRGQRVLQGAARSRPAEAPAVRGTHRALLDDRKPDASGIRGPPREVARAGRASCATT